MLEGMEHRMMLGRGGDQVPALRGATPRQPDHREVVGFGAAPGEDDLVRLCVEQPREAVAGVVDRRPGLATSGVDARGITKVPLQKRAHRGEDFGRERGGGVVVEVDQEVRRRLILILILIIILNRK